MLRTVKDACKLHPMALDYAMGEQIENLSDVIDRTAATRRILRQELRDQRHGDPLAARG